MFRLYETALAARQAPRRTTPGDQAWYSDAAIELALILRLVFHLALRQAEDFAKSALRLLGQELRLPDHTTLRTSHVIAGSAEVAHAAAAGAVPWGGCLLGFVVPALIGNACSAGSRWPQF